MMRIPFLFTRRSLAVLMLAAAVATTSCIKPPTAASYKLVWKDEFDGPTGQQPEASRWKYDVGTDWGNAQLEYDTARPENVSLDGQGHLAITARKEVYLGQQYTSGRINTSGLFAQDGGRFEARMRLPAGRGMWPAFWLLGANISSVPWPGCGELDIMEARGQEPAAVVGSMHGPGYSGGAALTKKYVQPANLSEDFHVYAVEWSSKVVTWSIDGYVYETIAKDNLPTGTTWVFDHPFFIILNLAVGGNFVGPPDGTTAFPQNLLVDYVRVYKKS
jgi:beta-glucanase (GH16 family)